MKLTEPSIWFFRIVILSILALVGSMWYSINRDIGEMRKYHMATMATNYTILDMNMRTFHYVCLHDGSPEIHKLCPECGPDRFIGKTKDEMLQFYLEHHAQIFQHIHDNERELSQKRFELLQQDIKEMKRLREKINENN